MMQNQWSHFMHFPEDFGGSLEWTKLSTGLFCFHIWIKFNNRKRYIQQAKSKLCKLTRQNLWFYGLPSSEQVMLNTISHGGLMFCQQHWRWITICTTDTFSQLKLLFQLYLTQILSSLPILSNNFSLLNCYHAIVYPQKPEMLACLLPSPWPLHQPIMEGILRFPINLSEINWSQVSSLKATIDLPRKRFSSNGNLGVFLTFQLHHDHQVSTLLHSAHHRFSWFIRDPSSCQRLNRV